MQACAMTSLWSERHSCIVFLLQCRVLIIGYQQIIFMVGIWLVSLTYNFQVGGVVNLMACWSTHLQTVCLDISTPCFPDLTWIQLYSSKITNIVDDYVLVFWKVYIFFYTRVSRHVFFSPVVLRWPYTRDFKFLKKADLGRFLLTIGPLKSNLCECSLFVFEDRNFITTAVIYYFFL